MESAAFLSGNKVNNNEIIANGADGIQLSFMDTGVVSNNYIRGAADGVKFIDSKDVACNGNMVSLATGWGLRAIAGTGPGSDRISFTGNQVRGSGLGGLEMTSSGGDHFVNANDFNNSGTSSITDNSIPSSNVVSGGNNV